MLIDCLSNIKEDSTKDLKHVLNLTDCWESKKEVLWNATRKELGSNSTSDRGTGCILLVCGFLAPSAEMAVRLVHNIILMFDFGSRCPKFAECFGHIYEGSHGVLQHLTQFKLFLVFLQMLVGIKLFGQNIMEMKAEEGVQDFVVFVCWSIFLNTVVRKAQKEIQPGKSVLDNLLPPAKWFPKLLANYQG